MYVSEEGRENQGRKIKKKYAYQLKRKKKSSLAEKIQIGEYEMSWISITSYESRWQWRYDFGAWFPRYSQPQT